MENWIIYAIISAITFALGDLSIVFSSINQQANQSNIIFVIYTALMGICSILYIIFSQEYSQYIISMTPMIWRNMLIITALFIIAYFTHYKAITQALNPGYANAIIMFHVAILTLLSYYYLEKPIDLKIIGGVILMLIGAIIISYYSSIAVA